jgi:hypothetical protein
VIGLLISLIFAYRSFYSMRIGGAVAESPPAQASAPKVEAKPDSAAS